MCASSQARNQSQPSNTAPAHSASEISVAPTVGAAVKNSVWSVQLARVTTEANLWKSTADLLEKSELSKGLYQQIQMYPAKFQFFTFQ
jgi:hypothetical protein